MCICLLSFCLELGIFWYSCISCGELFIESRVEFEFGHNCSGANGQWVREKEKRADMTKDTIG